jgi:murein DD-endopeptidase MepM/ murein hydrolase activator NlpD
MRNQFVAVRPKILRQAALVALLAGASAACSGGSERFSKPFFTGSTENQREIIGGTNTAMNGGDTIAAPQSGVARADLPPAGGDTYGNDSYGNDGDAYAPPRPQASAAPISGPYGWSTVGGEVVTVRPGESLDVLAIRYGVPSNQIAIANKISSPSQLTPGKVIIIPVKVAASEATMPARAVETASAEPVRSKKGAASHTVVPGDTLYGIARTYGVRPSEIVSLNGLSSPEAIRIGQRLTLPGGATGSEKVRVASTNNPETFGGTKVLGTVPAKASKVAASEPLPEPATIAVARAEESAKGPETPAMPSVPVSKSAPTVDAAAVDEATDPPSANGTSFRWPVRGRIISGFGAKPNGEKNDGINLAVPEGTSVKAAETGTVIYAGNELEGFGNLVLIRHADGWVSAYAHNSSIKVKRGDTVRRGQTVATAGASGSVSSPQVHFELRKGAKPVNPLDYLANG